MNAGQYLMHCLYNCLSYKQIPALKINDKSHRGRNTTYGALGLFYSLPKHGWASSVVSITVCWHRYWRKSIVLFLALPNHTLSVLSYRIQNRAHQTKALCLQAVIALTQCSPNRAQKPHKHINGPREFRLQLAT